MWTDIFIQKQKTFTKNFKDFLKDIEKFKNLIENDEIKKIFSSLKRNKKIRKSIVSTFRSKKN